ncbi:MAG: 4Fe-4S ferredoxin [Clostridia bacterium]|nr:4Fe-4S ferredoxin [Clostridia bacterium]
MSKTWYPVISYENCTECGACFNKCSHGVFELKASCPVVVHPEGCVQGCHGCGNLCPVGAIEYVGDNTGWVPPGKKDVADEACCSDNKGKGCCSGSSCCG